MKTNLIPVLLFALCSSLATQAQTVTSSNAVGMVKITIPTGGLAFLTYPFVKDNGEDLKVEEAFASLPNNSQIFVWNTATQGYITVTKFPFGWNPANTPLPKGTGFFVLPSGAAPVEVILSGEVPGSESHAQTSTTVKTGFNAIGFPYPVETTVENSGFNAIASNNDQLSVWNNNSQGYITVTKFPFGWNPANTVIPAGSAVFYYTAQTNPSPLLTTPPYSWPNN